MNAAMMQMDVMRAVTALAIVVMAVAATVMAARTAVKVVAMLVDKDFICRKVHMQWLSQSIVCFIMDIAVATTSSSDSEI